MGVTDQRLAAAAAVLIYACTEDEVPPELHSASCATQASTLVATGGIYVAVTL